MTREADGARSPPRLGLGQVLDFILRAWAAMRGTTERLLVAPIFILPFFLVLESLIFNQKMPHSLKVHFPAVFCVNTQLSD